MKHVSRRLIGQRIRQLREALGLRQEDLANRALLNQSYLSQIENGRREPSLETLERIATALGVSVSELIREPDSEEADIDFSVWHALIRTADPEDREIAMAILAKSRRNRDQEPGRERDGIS